MRWYEGGIAEAVGLSRRNNSIFVVYVEGKDDKSAELTKVIDAEDVSSKLESDSFVAIKIEANSVPHQQFSEIYNQVNVPSIYFIGKSGTPLEIIEAASGADEFIKKIDEILKKNGSPTDSKSKITSDFILQESKSATINEGAAKLEEPTKIQDAAAASSSESDIDVKAKENELVNSSANNKANPEHVDNPGESSNNSTEVQTTNAETEMELSHDDKVERAKALIEKKRLEKQQEEEEKERNKELERRKMGQDVQKLKRWQQDQELKNIIEEREREKKEQQAARQRILAQIEQDKADRAARFATASSSQAPSCPPITTQPTPRTPTDSNVARLQFKLPDGSSHTHKFPNDSTLLQIRNYIKTNLNLPFNNFTLAVTFPRREFTADDDSQTLQELQLVPTAVILILPLTQSTVAPNPGNLAAFFWYLVAPFLNILGYLKNMIFPGSSSNRSQGDSSPNQENKRPHDNTAESSRPLPKRRAGETTVIRRQGNVHRLTDKSDSDDENNTWNGNSTQQM